MLVLLLGSSFSGFSAGQKISQKGLNVSLQDIVLGDDAFHGKRTFPSTEWWYFDAIFDDRYSAEMSVRVLSALQKGIVISRLNIYDQGSLLSSDYASYQLNEFSASLDVPLVQINGNTVISGSYDNTTGNFIYDVSFEFPQCAAALHYVGCTKGWKRQQQTGEWWVVVLPQATVTGTIIVNNTTKKVSGTGYHDHDWDVTWRTALNYGWFWGHVSSSNYTATWATILSTRATVKPMLVVNENNAGYLDVPSKTIWFSAKDIHLDHGRFVPYFFNIETMTDDVFLVVNMQVVSIHHEPFISLVNYWRYHVKCTGTIIMNGHIELVDGVFIAEYLQFR
jgi:predicted secreted hydrolase